MGEGIGVVCGKGQIRIDRGVNRKKGNGRSFYSTDSCLKAVSREASTNILLPRFTILVAFNILQLWCLLHSDATTSPIIKANVAFP